MDPQTNAFRGRLLEAMPLRAIDFRPRLARAMDALAALRERDRAEIFTEIALRVDECASRRFQGERP